MTNTGKVIPVINQNFVSGVGILKVSRKKEKSKERMKGKEKVKEKKKGKEKERDQIRGEKENQ